MKFWRLIAILLLGMVTCSSNSQAQGNMQPEYTFSQILYWLPTPGTATSVEVGIYVSGDTICFPYCLMGVTHHYDLFAGLGSVGQECVGPNVG
jgi:hypothetical protein